MKDEDSPKPVVRLAVENDDTTIRGTIALREIEYALRKLSSNLIRVVRGAGKSDEIGRDCAAVIEAFESYRSAIGHYPSSFELDRMLSIDDDAPEDIADAHWERRDAMDTIIRGSLRVTAAKLLDQSLQISAGERDLQEGLRAFQHYRETMAAKTRQEARMAPSKFRRPKPR